MRDRTDKPAIAARGAAIPKRLKVESDRLVRQSLPGEGRSLPLMFTPETDRVDLAAWAGAHRELIDRSLQVHGGLLFRGFGIDAQEDFERFIDAMAIVRMSYVEGATPRIEVGKQVYTSTEFPREHPIALHNELSYARSWPMKIAFCCLQPPDTQGETPIADMRRVLTAMPADVRDTFAQRQWMLVRNYGGGLGLPWESVFHTPDREAVEDYCRASAMTWEWRGDNQLRTRQVRPAITRHPSLGDPIWFNHIAFWHASSLDAQSRQMLLSSFGEEGLPYNTYYGDGGPIDATVVDMIRRVIEAETVRLPWERGDVLFLDNMLVAHGRSPYTGPRKVIVAMGEACLRAGLESRPA